MAEQKNVSVYSTENREVLPIYPLDVFRASEKGEAEINASATALPAQALQLLVLMDGTANVGDLEQKLAHIPAESLRNMVRALLRDGLVRQPTVEEETGLDLTSFFAATAPQPEPSEGAKASADREAAEGVPALEADGYYVSIARQPAAGKTAAGAQPVVLLIDDDPDFCALIERLLGNAGYAMRVAKDRAEIVAELTRAAPPDLVLLDVNLPGTNGFEILRKMKQAPALKATPVIMTTAEATRESVMRGLVGGADGYLTKPLKSENLLKAVRTVLGLPGVAT
jgi:two-component system OmpR family response regulator